MILDKSKLIKNNNILKNNLGIHQADPPKKFEPGDNINVLYYDENVDQKRDIPDVLEDCILFERIIRKGIFVLVSDENRLKLVMNEIQKNNEKNNKPCYFVLIVSGSSCDKFMKNLDEQKMDLFKSGCIYTTDFKGYNKIKDDFVSIN